MPKRHFNKKNATTFQLVHRSQRDPQIHNDEATQRVLVPVQTVGRDNVRAEAGSASETPVNRLLDESSNQQGSPPGDDAANYGVFFDDSQYDYMQHLRPTGNLGAVLIENATAYKSNKNGVELKENVQLPVDVLPSSQETPRNYQDQQAIQDDIGGFHPDLDPRIREVLAALEDSEDGNQEDSEEWFSELTKDGPVSELEETPFDDEDDGWDSDATTRATTTKRGPTASKSEWEQEFGKFKRAGDKAIVQEGSVASSAFTAASNGRIRIGAGSIGTGFSMSSSALYRTEGLTLLDDRFDRIDREYEQDEEDFPEVVISATAVRQDFDSIMDDFLGEYANMGNKGQTKKARNPYTLDDARIALGNVKLKGTTIASKS